MNGNTAPLQKEIDDFCDVFMQDKIECGFVYDIVYKPETGVTVYTNGIAKTTVKGLEFKKVLWGIWLCDSPADANLK